MKILLAFFMITPFCLALDILDKKISIKLLRVPDKREIALDTALSIICKKIGAKYSNDNVKWYPGIEKTRIKSIKRRNTPARKILDYFARKYDFLYFLKKNKLHVYYKHQEPVPGATFKAQHEFGRDWPYNVPYLYVQFNKGEIIFHAKGNVYYFHKKTKTVPTFEPKIIREIEDIWVPADSPRIGPKLEKPITYIKWRRWVAKSYNQYLADNRPPVTERKGPPLDYYSKKK